MEVKFRNGCVRIYGGRCENYVNLTGEQSCDKIIKLGGADKDLNKMVKQLYSGFNQELLEESQDISFKLPNPGYIEPPINGGLEEAKKYESKCDKSLKMLVEEYGL